MNQYDISTLHASEQKHMWKESLGGGGGTAEEIEKLKMIEEFKFEEKRLQANTEHAEIRKRIEELKVQQTKLQVRMNKEKSDPQIDVGF